MSHKLDFEAGVIESDHHITCSSLILAVSYKVPNNHGTIRYPIAWHRSMLNSKKNTGDPCRPRIFQYHGVAETLAACSNTLSVIH